MSLVFDSTLRWEDFVRSLVDQSHGHPEIAAGSSPIRKVPSIPFGSWDAPRSTRMLVWEIMTSSAVIDRSGAPDHINGGEVGAMRQIHANDPMYLPRFQYANNPALPSYLRDLSDRARLYV